MSATRNLYAVALLLLGLFLAAGAQRADAASSKGCVGGGFSLVTPGGAPVSAAGAASDGPFVVRGTYVEFTVDPATLGVTDYTLTGAPNPLDITGGRRTPLFAAKTPDLGARTLTGALTAQITGQDILLARSGDGVSMKIQAKDCAQGGTFQMEPARADLAPTVITHTLADGIFYFDNPFFRERVGQVLNGVAVATRVNFANDTSPNLVGRDSTQVASKLAQTARTSVWSVASGGRMGGVLGEDAVEVAPPATDCLADCQAQNQARGAFVVLGFPFPVPAASRLAGAPAAPAATSTAPAAAAATPVTSTPATATPRQLAMRVHAGARTVRVAVYRVRAGRLAGRPVSTSYRAVRRGTRVFSFRLDGSALLRGLKAGRYELQLRGGRDRAHLGPAARLRFTV